MKRIVCLFLTLLALLALPACREDAEGADGAGTPAVGGPSEPTTEGASTEKPVVGTVYAYKEGVGGEFVIKLYSDGTFLYSTGPASIYLLKGTWRMADGVITMKTGDEYALVHCFEKRLDGLFYLRREGDTDFLDCTVPEGAAFKLQIEE